MDPQLTEGNWTIKATLKIDLKQQNHEHNHRKGTNCAEYENQTSQSNKKLKNNQYYKCKLKAAKPIKSIKLKRINSKITNN